MENEKRIETRIETGILNSKIPMPVWVVGFLILLLIVSFIMGLNFSQKQELVIPVTLETAIQERGLQGKDPIIILEPSTRILDRLFFWNKTDLKDVLIVKYKIRNGKVIIKNILNQQLIVPITFETQVQEQVLQIEKIMVQDLTLALPVSETIIPEPSTSLKNKILFWKNNSSNQQPVVFPVIPETTIEDLVVSMQEKILQIKERTLEDLTFALPVSETEAIIPEPSTSLMNKLLFWKE